MEEESAGQELDEDEVKHTSVVPPTPLMSSKPTIIPDLKSLKEFPELTSFGAKQKQVKKREARLPHPNCVDSGTFTWS